MVCKCWSISPVPQLPQCKRSLEIEMLRNICRQGSHSQRQSAWQDNFFFLFLNLFRVVIFLPMCPNVVFVYSLCSMLIYRIPCFAASFLAPVRAIWVMGSMKGKRMGSSQRLHMWTGNTRGRPNIQISHTWRGFCWSFVAFGGVIVF